MEDEDESDTESSYYTTVSAFTSETQPLEDNETRDSMDNDSTPLVSDESQYDYVYDYVYVTEEDSETFESIETPRRVSALPDLDESVTLLSVTDDLPRERDVQKSVYSPLLPLSLHYSGNSGKTKAGKSPNIIRAPKSNSGKVSSVAEKLWKNRISHLDKPANSTPVDSQNFLGKSGLAPPDVSSIIVTERKSLRLDKHQKQKANSAKRFIRSERKPLGEENDCCSDTDNRPKWQRTSFLDAVDVPLSSTHLDLHKQAKQAFVVLDDISSIIGDTNLENRFLVSKQLTNEKTPRTKSPLNQQKPPKFRTYGRTVNKGKSRPVHSTRIFPSRSTYNFEEFSNITIIADDVGNGFSNEALPKANENVLLEADEKCESVLDGEVFSPVELTVKQMPPTKKKACTSTPVTSDTGKKCITEISEQISSIRSSGMTSMLRPPHVSREMISDASANIHYSDNLNNNLPNEAGKRTESENRQTSKSNKVIKRSHEKIPDDIICTLDFPPATRNHLKLLHVPLEMPVFQYPSDFLECL